MQLKRHAKETQIILRFGRTLYSVSAVKEAGKMMISKWISTFKCRPARVQGSELNTRTFHFEIRKNGKIHVIITMCRVTVVSELTELPTNTVRNQKGKQTLHRSHKNIASGTKEHTHHMLKECCKRKRELKFAFARSCRQNPDSFSITERLHIQYFHACQCRCRSP